MLTTDAVRINTEAQAHADTLLFLNKTWPSLALQNILMFRELLTEHANNVLCSLILPALYLSFISIVFIEMFIRQSKWEGICRNWNCFPWVLFGLKLERKCRVPFLWKTAKLFYVCHYLRMQMFFVSMEHLSSVFSFTLVSNLHWCVYTETVIHIFKCRKYLSIGN